VSQSYNSSSLSHPSNFTNLSHSLSLSLFPSLPSPDTSILIHSFLRTHSPSTATLFQSNYPLPSTLPSTDADAFLTTALIESVRDARTNATTSFKAAQSYLEASNPAVEVEKKEKKQQDSSSDSSSDNDSDDESSSSGSSDSSESESESSSDSDSDSDSEDGSDEVSAAAPVVAVAAAEVDSKKRKREEVSFKKRSIVIEMMQDWRGEGARFKAEEKKEERANPFLEERRIFHRQQRAIPFSLFLVFP